MRGLRVQLLLRQVQLVLQALHLELVAARLVPDALLEKLSLLAHAAGELDAVPDRLREPGDGEHRLRRVLLHPLAE